MANEADGVTVVRASDCPDIFADDVLSFELINGLVRMSLSSVQMKDPAPPSENRHVIIGRIVMPVASAQRLALGLYDYLKQRGLDPAPQPEGSAAVN